MNIFKLLSIFIVTVSTCTISLSACSEQNKTALNTTEQSKANELKEQFKQWEKTQNPQLLKKYQNYLAKNLKNPPSLFDISINRHLTKPECLQYRFAIAPEKQWKNLVNTLQFIEKLQQQNIIGQYKIISVYRSQEANSCSRGAKTSKHLMNAAVDFQILDANGQPYSQINVQAQQKLCNFWHKHGRKYKMGLGTYHNNQYHIDIQRYQTWGATYKSDSSLCLNKKDST